MKRNEKNRVRGEGFKTDFEIVNIWAYVEIIPRQILKRRPLNPVNF